VKVAVLAKKKVDMLADLSDQMLADQLVDKLEQN
jgi:hypothetical protein